MINRGPFCVIVTDIDCIEVWLGKPKETESELVLSVHKSFLASLIAALKATSEELP
jgi:hypothetical protein